MQTACLAYDHDVFLASNLASTFRVKYWTSEADWINLLNIFTQEIPNADADSCLSSINIAFTSQDFVGAWIGKVKLLSVLEI